MNDVFKGLVEEYTTLLTPKQRFLKRINQDFVNKIQNSIVLKEYPSIDEKLWALKNNNCNRPTCYCGNYTNFHLKSLKYHQYCCSSCAIKDPATIDQRVSKRNLLEVGEKIREIVHNKYGKDEMVKRRKNGIIKKYGVDNYFATGEFQERMKQYNTIKYGVDHYSKTAECQQKIKQTCLTKYNASHYSKSELYKQRQAEYYEKSSNNTLNTHGVFHTSQIKIKDSIPLLNDFDWLYEQYVVLNRSTQDIVNELQVSSTTVLNYLRNHEIGIKYNVGYSYRCIEWLNYIMQNENVEIQHALNGGEYSIPNTRYRADGYCKTNNTIYEFHGDIWHGNLAVFSPLDKPNPYSDLTATELNNLTIIKENKIKELGYNLVTIWESEWMDR